MQLKFLVLINATYISFVKLWKTLINVRKIPSRLAAASDKAYQLLAHGRWFSPGTPAASTTKTGRHDIAEILLKVTIRDVAQ
jgi:hypothetical protein